MAKVKSEYEVESLFIDRLQEMNYEYINLRNYADVVDNFKQAVSASYNRAHANLKPQRLWQQA